MVTELIIYLNGGRLGNMYETAVNGFINKIDPQIHANAYVGTYGPHYAESEFAGKYLDTCIQFAKALGSVGRTEESRTAFEHAKLVVESIIRNQRSDGYIGCIESGKEAQGFAVWNQAFTLFGLLSYYELTCDIEALTCAERIAEYNASLFMNGADICSGGNNGSQHLSFLLPLVRLCKASDKPILHAFMKHIVNAIKASDNNFFEFDSILDLRSKKGIENFVILIGILEYGELTGDKSAFTACEKYCKELSDTQIRENGNGTLFEVWTKDGNAPKMLGADVRPDENCVAVGWCEFNLSLFYRTHEAKYIDAVERTLYNHLLGAFDESGTDFAYYQPNYGHRSTTTVESMYKCCRYRGFSAVSRITDMVFIKSGAKLYSMVYTNAVYEDDTIKITENSEYPYGARVNFTIEIKHSSTLELYLRVPQYVNGVQLSFDSNKYNAVIKNGYITFELPYAGDHELTLDFEIEIKQRTVVIDNVERVGYTYGCILLAAENDCEPTVNPELAPVKCGEFAFKAGETKLVDYASAGRENEFSVWSKILK